MNFRYVVVLLTCLGASIDCRATAEDKPLLLGDAAPKIEVREFVKGEPVKQLAPGKVYVVEFWATWCGPCLATIPHLTELQKKNPEVIFLGISLDEASSDVKTFVQEMGDKMDYRVAIDTRTKEAADGLMQKSWLAASFQEGIPVAFVVNKEGKLAWIGHPGELEEPLSQIIAGKWDLAAEVKKHSEAIAAKKQAAALEAEFNAAVEAKKYKQALEIIDKGLAANPDLESEWAIAKFWTLVLLKQTEQAVTYGNHLVDELFQEEPAQLLLIAGLIVRADEYAPFGMESENEKETGGETKAPGKNADAPKDDAKNPPASKESSDDAKQAKTAIQPKLDPKLVQLAIHAAEQAVALTVELPDVAQRTTIVEILAAAYAAGAEQEKATALLQAELEVLQHHSDVTKAAMLLLRSQLKELKSLENEKAKGGEDQPAKDSPAKDQSEKKANPDLKSPAKKST